MEDIAEELLLQKPEKKIGVWKASNVSYIFPLVSFALSKYCFSFPFLFKNSH